MEEKIIFESVDERNNQVDERLIFSSYEKLVEKACSARSYSDAFRYQRMLYVASKKCGKMADTEKTSNVIVFKIRPATFDEQFSSNDFFVCEDPIIMSKEEFEKMQEITF